MRTLHRTAATLAAGVLAVTLTACGSSDDETPNTEPGTTTTEADQRSSAAATTEDQDDNSGPNPTQAGSPDGPDDQPSDDQDNDDADQDDEPTASGGDRVEVTTTGSLGAGAPYTLFTVPSENIKCTVQTELRCDIEESDTGVRSVLLSADPGLHRINETNDAGPYRELELQGTSGQVIDYGSTAVAGAFECKSDHDGMRCFRQGDDSGFLISRESTRPIGRDQ